MKNLKTKKKILETYENSRNTSYEWETINWHNSAHFRISSGIQIQEVKIVHILQIFR